MAGVCTGLLLSVGSVGCVNSSLLLPEAQFMTEADQIPFSDEELLAAFRQLMSDVDAQKLVQELRKPPPEPPNRNVRGTRLTDDTLDLLAAVSDDLAKRVADYRRRSWFRSEK